MYFSYVSPEGSSIYNDSVGYNGIDLIEDNLLDIVSKHPDSYLLLAGDFNARCGDLQDILIDDDLEFIINEDDVYENDSFQEERKSKDKTINNFGLTLNELCKNFGVHIVNGRSNRDSNGEFTCTANEGCMFHRKVPHYIMTLWDITV